LFDWSWTQGCFGDKKITPMDFDGVVERKGNFLVFETKNLNVQIPSGQLYTLQALHRLGCFTILLIHGKTQPERIEVWYPSSTEVKVLHGVDSARQTVSGWYTWADSNPQIVTGFTTENQRQLRQQMDDGRRLAHQLIEAPGDKTGTHP
jgi:hypothetical protein